RVPEIHREGRRPRAALPAGHRQGSDGAAGDRDHPRPAPQVRGAPPGQDHRAGDLGGGAAGRPLHHGSPPPRQGHRRDRRGAVAAVARAIRRSRAGLKDAKRPVGSFVFLGPTGVGKTELARALAEYLFGDENALIRVDMSEYMEKFSVSRLLGAPPGYVGYEEGGFLTEKVRRRPYSVVLFDGIEKAHPDVFNMMLQVLDDGRLTDSLGHVVDFKNTILIMTSNLGTSLIGKRTSPGFLQESDPENYEKMKGRVMEELKRAFRPEFLNRIDDIIVFHPLSLDHIKAIVRLMIEKINKQLLDKDIQLTLTPAAETALVDKGYDATYGARQLRRTIQKHIEDPLAEAIVRGQVPPRARIEVDIEGDKFAFREVQPAEPPLELAQH